MKTLMKAIPDLPIHITPHHLTLTPTLVAKVREKIGPLVRIGGDAVRADVVLRLHHGSLQGQQFSASARLAMPGRDVHASVTDANLYKAITTLESLLARRLRKRKTRIEKRNETDRPAGGTTSAARLEAVILAA